MLLKSRALMLFLTLVLLARSAAGFAMQIDMAFAMAQEMPVNMAAPKPSCHEAAQTTNTNSSHLATIKVADNDATENASACSLCCIAVCIPSRFSFTATQSHETAPLAVLFNNLPAAAQRPAKPPLA